MSTATPRPRISVVIVSYDSAAELRRTLPALVGELGDDDELIIVDNASHDSSAAVEKELAPRAKLVRLDSNTGFASAANAGSREATGDLVVFLNPDAKPLPGWGEAIRRPLAEGRGWGAWQALVVCEDATRVNTVGNPVHFTGIAWAGGHGRPLPPDPQPAEVVTASGACLAVPIGIWNRLGGFPDAFFLYHEDVDLSMRIRVAGGTVGLEPGAVVDHEYEFGGRPEKWRWLERNRWACIVRIYPGSLLLLLAPALLATELALVPLSLAGGWARQKLLADFDVLRRLPALLRERRAVQATRTVSPAEFAKFLTPDLDSEFLGSTGANRLLRLGLRAYWRLVCALLPS
jgi:GT2 family glycosyltransferase